MRSSDDLLKLIGLLWEEMTHRGIDTVSNAIRFVDEDGVRVETHYFGIPNPRKYGISWTSSQLSEFNEEIAVGETTLSARGDQANTDSWHQKETLSAVISREDFASRMRKMTDYWGLDDAIPPPERTEWADANRVIADGTERLTRIVDSLLNFARLDETKFQMADIHEEIDSELTLFRSFGPSGSLPPLRPATSGIARTLSAIQARYVAVDGGGVHFACLEIWQLAIGSLES